MSRGGVFLSLAMLSLPSTAGAAPVPDAGPARYAPEALAAVSEMEQAALELRDYTMTLVKRELRETRMEPEETIAIKWQRPQRIYLHAIAGPHEGQEILYAPGWNKNRVKAHKGSFPDITLNLDPYGSLAMAHSHHPVPEISLVRLIERIAGNLKRLRDKGAGSIAFSGHETLFGRAVVKIEVGTPPMGVSPTLEKGQTLWDLARATGQSMYVILHANRARGWTEAEHARPGDAVIVPDFYASRMTLWVDDELHVPLQVDLYDHEGRLYEHYEHRDVKLNVGLGDSDFDPKNKTYKF
jgi:outer membrane lipoprotein-sorting protein